MQDIICDSWRNSTKKQYNSYLCKWITYCEQNNCDICYPSVADILEFLAHLFDSGLGYSAINTARSALSSVLILKGEKHSIGEHPLVTRLLRAIYQNKPTMPRYTGTWSAKTVLDYLKTLSPAHKLSLKMLSMKLVVLCLLVTGGRCQTMQFLNLKHMTVGKSSYKFRIVNLAKTSSPNRAQPLVTLPAYPADRRLCVYNYLKHYIQVTKDIRSDDSLFVSFCKPHKGVTCSSLARWTKLILAKAGIDISIYKAHSTRAASTSSALKMNVPIDTILKAAGWTNDCTFKKFYNKPVVDDELFARTILDSACDNNMS